MPGHHARRGDASRRDGRGWHAATLLAAALALLPACAKPIRQPNLGGLYTRSAQAEQDTRAPVVVLPGILGSRLVHEPTGQVVWGAFTNGAADPNNPADARLIAHPMAEGVPLADLRDDVRPDGALDRVKVNVLGIPVELNAYLDIMATLGVGGYRDQQLALAGAVDYGEAHYTCSQFAYDWRRDIAESARALHEAVTLSAEYAAFVRGQTDPVRVELVAHSMGGLVARYYLMYGTAELPEEGPLPPPTWAGAKYVRRLIMIGTPNAGSALSVRELVKGKQIGPFLPTYSAALLGTMPAIYELMPRTRHAAVIDEQGAAVDLFDPANWERYGWGLADPDAAGELRALLPDAPDDAARRRIAMDHLAKCLRRAERLHEALDVPADPPEGVTIHLIAGDAEATASRFQVSDSGRLTQIGTSPGDRVVTRDSALLDERAGLPDGAPWPPRLQTPMRLDSVMFLFQDHLGLTKDPGFADNVLYLLLEEPRAEAPIMR